jgi:Archaeal fructose-1,6-bisphosphatase and related enzymes of inositol monophosphatase family
VTSGQINTYRALLATCVASATRAAQLIRERTTDLHQLTWENKSQFDFVSDVDRAAEQAITEIIESRHPDARILGEELSPTMSDRAGLVFVADPLDGTTNFLHGLPWYAVSIAAMIDDELVAAAVINVPNGELFTATAGGGARLNGQPIAVSPITDPARSIVGTGFPFKGDEHVDEYLLMLPRIMRETAGIRRPGAASLDLASVAAGRYEGFWEITLAPWDIAAGLLLIREAGGIVTDLAGASARVDHTGLVTGNREMHEWLMEIVGAGR